MWSSILFGLHEGEKSAEKPGARSDVITTEQQNLLCSSSQTSSSGSPGGCETSRSSSQPAAPRHTLDRLTPPPATLRAHGKPSPRSSPPLRFLIEFPLLLRNRIPSLLGQMLGGECCVRVRSREAGAAPCLGGAVGCDWTKEEEEKLFPSVRLF